MSSTNANAASDAWSWLSNIDPAVTSAWISGGLTAIATVLAVMIAASYAYMHAREHSQRAHNAAVRVDRLRREIDALERVWSLLAYMAERENDSVIVRWREDPQKNKTYYVDLANLRRFVLTEMPAAFYTQHAGLHLPNTIRDQLFEYALSDCRTRAAAPRTSPSLSRRPRTQLAVARPSHGLGTGGCHGRGSRRAIIRCRPDRCR